MAANALAIADIAAALDIEGVDRADRGEWVYLIQELDREWLDWAAKRIP